MFCTTSETEGEVVYVKLVEVPPQEFITDRSKAVVLLWISVACFGVRVSVTFHLTCVHFIFCPVWVAEWPSFRKKLLTRLTVCSLCVLTIFNFGDFPFWF